MTNERDYRPVVIGRLVRHVEREIRFLGVDVEPEITRILEKLDAGIPKGQGGQTKLK